MTVQSLNELDCAVKYLREHGACRDGLAGLWALPDGIALGANPIGAAKALRTAMIQRKMDAVRDSGRGYFTR